MLDVTSLSTEAIAKIKELASCYAGAPVPFDYENAACWELYQLGLATATGLTWEGELIASKLLADIAGAP